MDAKAVEHLNPAQRLVARYCSQLMDEVGDALQTLRQAGAPLELEKFEKLIDITIRGFVAEGYWSDAGITDVRELYDLHVQVRADDATGKFYIGIFMPNVIKKVAEQDDPDAN